MSHHLEIDTYGDELHLRLICTATPGSDCRKRPADPEQESWASDDPPLTDGHECWAVEWVESGGWECIGSARVVEAFRTVERRGHTTKPNRDRIRWQRDTGRAES